jgi:hypothetical protein
VTSTVREINAKNQFRPPFFQDGGLFPMGDFRGFLSGESGDTIEQFPEKICFLTYYFLLEPLNGLIILLEVFKLFNWQHRLRSTETVNISKISKSIVS